MAGGPVDQVRARLDIVDVVSERVALKKAGKTLKGLCPFHTEKTPSFIVFPESQRWHCFGCGKGGDAFGFVMESQNLGFAEALGLLAAKTGVEIHRERRDVKAEETGDRLHAVNEAAARYFRAMLAGPAGARARAYTAGRDISTESLEAFELGFAPDGGSALAHHLLQEGLSRSDILQAGVAGENETGGIYDRFRNRLIFPIRDVSGKLIGFGGRALGDTQPKYLNTPQTPLFDKGGSLYLLDRAKGEIRTTRQAVIVEGYMDALMAHQHGFRNVVASLGTALTDRHVALLKRYASEILFALDPDTAGQEATARGLSVAMEALDREAMPVPTWKGLVDFAYKLKTTIRIIGLPKDQDPDELIKKRPEEWQRLIREAVPVQDFFLSRVRARHDLTTAAGKASAVEEAMAVIAEIPEPVQQAHYVQRLASLVGIEESYLLQQMRGRRRRRHSRDASSPKGRVLDQILDNEPHCLALLLTHPELLATEPRLREQDFQDPTNRELFRRLVGLIARGIQPDELLDSLREELGESLWDALEGILGLKQRYPELLGDPVDKAYRSAALTLQVRTLQLRRQHLDDLASSTGEDSDAEDMTQLAILQREVTQEAHRLQLLGGTIPLLRAIHKEVRHGG